MYKIGLASVKNLLALKLLCFSAHLHGKEKKRGSFKTSMSFTEAS